LRTVVSLEPHAPLTCPPLCMKHLKHQTNRTDEALSIVVSHTV
jgi:hypothetical protein